MAGLLGVVLYIASDFLLHGGLVRISGYIYPAVYLTADGPEFFSLSQSFSRSSAIIQTMLIVISLFGIGRIIRFDA
ncbi:hypothetical protein MGEO_16415 [Marivita geojedonensis]|uniref:CBU-0592-like domain-containing protein n=1 Tax=Marivita geojedonensis TaxID=1123756 RepID=A0A1X4NHI3_9RHOB|nr:hypothetical protein [Marivita geojedonensis]OSQ46979.1 hypothetical protein MGEO_16415 [Marivita geojedonensis]